MMSIWSDPYAFRHPFIRAWHRLWDFWYVLADHKCKTCIRWSKTVGEQEFIIENLEARLGIVGVGVKNIRYASEAYTQKATEDAIRANKGKYPGWPAP